VQSKHKEQSYEAEEVLTKTKREFITQWEWTSKQ